MRQEEERLQEGKDLHQEEVQEPCKCSSSLVPFLSVISLQFTWPEPLISYCFVRFLLFSFSLSLSLSHVLSSARTVPNVVVIAATSGKITLKTSATSIIEGNSKGQIEKQQSRPYIIQQNHSGRGIWPVMGSLILATIPRYAPCLQTDRLELN